MNKTKNVMKVFYVFICCILSVNFLGCEQFWKLYDPQITTEYNNKVAKVQEVFVDHDRDIWFINECVGFYTKYQTKEHLLGLIDAWKMYLKQVDKWRDKAVELKSYIEHNDKRLRRVGINPDYARDNVVKVIESLQANEIKFRQALATQKALMLYSSLFLRKSKSKRQ